MIKISIKGDFKSLQNKLEKIKSDVDDGTFLTRLAAILNGAIQTRVQRFGIGLNNQPMKKYAKTYAKLRDSEGRNTKFRDLTRTGKMWQSLTTTRQVDGVKMFFGNAESINKANWNQQRTKFFGISSKEKQIINSEMKKLTNGIK